MALSKMRNNTFRWLGYFCGTIAGFVFFKMGNAQTFPVPNDTLNFTSVCFTFPWENDATKHTLILFQGNQELRKTSAANKIIVEGLSSNKSYRWTLLYQDNQGYTIKKIDTSNFFIAPQPMVILYRFMANDSTQRNNDLLILDYAHSAINRSGKLVWYLPGIVQTTNIRDLRITDEGTFTAIIDGDAKEMDLKGHTIWKAPNNGEISGAASENYHHHFQKLASGNYLVLGSEFKRYKFPQSADSVSVEMGTVIEYTPDKKIAWCWRSSDFLKSEHIPLEVKDDKYIGKVHMNAVCMANGFVYVGFRDLSWIVKLEKATKKVVAIYGGNDSKLPFHYGRNMFRFQHDVVLLRDGTIGVLNNDSIDDPNVVSSVVLFNEKPTAHGQLKAFEFPFNFDANTNGKSLKLGNFFEYPNGNLLINMGGINRIVEVTRDKKVVWDVFVEKYDLIKKVWRFFPQYRVSSASSLYPNEFSVKITKAKARGGYSCYYFITNVGSEINSYTIYLDKLDKKIKLTTTEPLSPNQSSTAEMVLPVEFRTQKNISIVVEVNGKTKYERLIYPN